MQLSDPPRPDTPPAPAPSGRFATFAALRSRNFRFYWIGLVLYVLGQRTEYVTFAWLIWELTRDPLYLGYLGLAQGLPYLLLQLGGGVLADRFDRLRLLVITQSCTAITMTLTFILLVTGQARVEYLLLLGALSSSFRAFDEPSRMALLPQLTPRDELPNAIALGTIPWPAGRVIAPSIAGLMIAAFGAPIGFAFATAASLAALGLYSRISVPVITPPADGPGLLGQLIEGLDFVRRNFLFASIISLALFHSLFGLSYITLLPIYADLYFEAGSSGYGLLQAAHGLGAVVSTLIIASVTHRLRRRGLAALWFGTVFGLLLALLSLSATLPIAMVVLICMGLTNTFFLMQLNTILQQQVPDALRGRVMSLFSLGYNLVPIGGLISGGLAAAVDARFALLVSGLLVAAASFLALVTSRRLRAVP